MQSQSKERKFVSVWLRRARKELAVSGRLEEVAQALFAQEASTREHVLHVLRDWRGDLQRLRMGVWEPSMEDLMKIDAVLSRPKQDRTISRVSSEELFLFS